MANKVDVRVLLSNVRVYNLCGTEVLRRTHFKFFTSSLHHPSLFFTMSLAYKSGFYAAVALLVPTALPESFALRLPTITLRLPALFSRDERLQELKNLLENSDEAPFFIDNGMILRAVPKKKPSYRRTRQKLFAPGQKQIQPLGNLVRCPACGHVKRSHFMCMHCFGEIKTFLKAKKKSLQQLVEPPQSNLDKIDEKIIYPGKRESEHQRLLNKKDWIPVREEPLMFDAEQAKNPKK